MTEENNNVSDLRERRQLKALSKHNKKADHYRAKKLDEISKKVNLGVMQIVGAMKKTPWCARVTICWEILFKRVNKNYDEAGEWVGKPEHMDRAPWCVRLANTLKFWKKESQDG